jgi:hypothetical protein
MVTSIFTHPGGLLAIGASSPRSVFDPGTFYDVLQLLDLLIQARCHLA